MQYPRDVYPDEAPEGTERPDSFDIDPFWSQLEAASSPGPLEPLATRTETALRKVVQQLPDGGEVREGQLDMACWIADGYENETHVVVQAPTGTGKTLAYLIPSILRQQSEGNHRTIIATATKALQDQLAGKDLPFLRQHLGEFSYAVLKGRSNYLCLQRLAELQRESEGTLKLDGQFVDVRNNGLDLNKLETWATTTESGDRAYLPDPISDEDWQKVSVTSDECPGAKKCPKGSTCLSERARHQAEKADVVIVNQHLYGLDILHDILPEHDAVVLDEAHQAEEIFAQALTVWLSPNRIYALVKRCEKLSVSVPLVDDLRNVASDLHSMLTPMLGERLPGGFSEEQTVILERAIGHVSDLRDELETLHARATRHMTDPHAESEQLQKNAGDRAQETLRLSKSSERLYTDLWSLRNIQEDTHVLWVDGKKNPKNSQISALRLGATPIYIGETLSESLWPHKAAVLTSATIPLNTVERLGLPFATIEGEVDSPFDLKNNGLIYCPPDMPDHREAGAEIRRTNDLLSLINAAEGRTLALFTSYKAMNAAAEQISRQVPWPILVQGAMPPAMIRKRFTDDEQTCLFATLSFWEGLDVPGPSCSLVAIDKLPFARPDDPVMQARRDAAGKAAFRKVDLPLTATRLAQGSGRLIRTATDKGVVAIFDSRLVNARYGATLQKALPAMSWASDREEAERFLRSLRTEQLAFT